MFRSKACTESTDNISDNEVFVYGFYRKVNKRRKRAGIFVFSNLLTFLLGNFGILTKLQSMAGLEKYETLRKEVFFFLPIILYVRV